MRAKNALCATVEAKVLKVKRWVVKLEEEELEVKLEEELEVKTRLRRRSRCLEASLQSSSRSLTGLYLGGMKLTSALGVLGGMMIIASDDVDSR